MEILFYGRTLLAQLTAINPALTREGRRRTRCPRCPPKLVLTAARFFTLCRLTVQPPQSYSVGGQRSSGQLTGKFFVLNELTKEAEGIQPALTSVPGQLQQREPVFYLPVFQDYSSRGSLSCTYLCYRTTPAEGAYPVLTCDPGQL
ncbi:UNVERIFIED_CONTAM: hypothetical protein FKN15_057344 [Acipenser sinensis]